MKCIYFMLFRLRTAKESELRKKGVWRLEKDVALHINKKELAKHGKHRTRGAEETTTRLLKDLIHTFTSERGRDTMGIPLCNSENMQQIWREQCHIACIQDPMNVQLYTKTGSIKKGGLELPVYRCARGSTSLESFHNHIDRFIPGNKDIVALVIKLGHISLTDIPSFKRIC